MHRLVPLFCLLTVFSASYADSLSMADNSTIENTRQTATGKLSQDVSNDKAEQPTKERLNVLFILVDDLGWSDTQLYEQTQYYSTPNILRLAKGSTSFTQAYTVSPVCTPTRASILTGLHNARLGMSNARGHIAQQRLNAASVKAKVKHLPSEEILSVSRLDTKYYTLNQLFNENGYSTAHIGKWHLGASPYGPMDHGFDYTFPQDANAAIDKSYFAPWPSLVDEGIDEPPGTHIEDLMADKAVSFIKNHKDKPFFLNYWSFSIHSPWSAKKDLVKQYAKNINPLSPQQNPIYAAMVETLDTNIGKLLDALEQHDLLDKTVIIFTSDNGGNTFAPRQTEPAGWENIPGTSNSPLREGKARPYDGGHRVPLIIRWPQLTQTARNNTLVTSTDFFPTLLEGLALNTSKAPSFDGVSFLESIKGNELNREAIYGYFPVWSWGINKRIPPAAWVRDGDWKLIRFFNSGNNFNDEYELYNIKRDISETANLVQRYPDIKKHLQKKLTDFLQETEAPIPKANVVQ